MTQGGRRCKAAAYGTQRLILALKGGTQNGRRLTLALKGGAQNGGKQLDAAERKRKRNGGRNRGKEQRT